MLLQYIIDRINQDMSEDRAGDSLFDGRGENIVANVEILTKLCEMYHFIPRVSIDEILVWKKDYLKVFDRVTHLSKINSEYHVKLRAERRVIIERTFDRLLSVITGLQKDIWEL